MIKSGASTDWLLIHFKIELEYPFSRSVFLICNPKRIRGRLELRLQNSPKLPRMLDCIVMQIRKVGSKKGY